MQKGRGAFMNYSDNRYTYLRRGIMYSIYDGSSKIAEIVGNTDERPAIAREMVRALNARDRYLKAKQQPQSFNKYE
jgi:hypothetical protein